MALGIYAGTSASTMTALPSPVQLTPTAELIWSENTGRAQSGTNKAKMIGDVVAEKRTYKIQWGYLTATEYALIKSKLTPGFFTFGVGLTPASAQAAAGRYYRSEITAEMVQVGRDYYYKDATVSVIEQ